MSAMRLLSLGAVVYLAAGCSGMSEQACVTADWRTVGFEDGTAGRSEGSIGRYRQQCSEHGVTPDLESYRAGHAEGVQIYCKESNGFAVGHSGAQYQGVCPADLEPRFLAEYNSGRRLHELGLGGSERRRIELVGLDEDLRLVDRHRSGGDGLDGSRHVEQPTGGSRHPSPHPDGHAASSVPVRRECHLPEGRIRDDREHSAGGGVARPRRRARQRPAA